MSSKEFELYRLKRYTMAQENINERHSTMSNSKQNMNSKSIPVVHKTVKYRKLIVSADSGGKPLKKALTLKERRELQTKMTKVFKRNIKGLSTELQRILIDDLVTAFQNRMNVLIRAQAKRSY
jgi:hypothetical protein